MVYIYILILEEKKFYIGKTNNPETRIKQHFCENGSVWTSKYRPINLYELIPDCDDFDEDKYTIKYMAKHGIDNVRGGSFCQLELNSATISNINNVIKNSLNNCNYGKNNNSETSDSPIYSKQEDMAVVNIGGYIGTCNKNILCRITGHESKKKLGWNKNYDFDIGFFVVDFNVVFAYYNNDTFYIKHPEKNIYLDHNLQTTNELTDSCLFTIEKDYDCEEYCYIKFSNENYYLQAKKTCFGHYLKKSDNTCNSEKFTITIITP